MQAEGRRDESIMPRRRRLKPRKDCVAILGKLSLLVNPITLVFTLLGYGGWLSYFLVSPLLASADLEVVYSVGTLYLYYIYHFVSKIIERFS